MANVYIQTCAIPPVLNVGYLNACPQIHRGSILVDPVVLQSTVLEIKTTPEPIDPERVADMQSLFIAFLAALVAIWGLKQLLNLFTSDIEK